MLLERLMYMSQGLAPILAAIGLTNTVATVLSLRKTRGQRAAVGAHAADDQAPDRAELDQH